MYELKPKNYFVKKYQKLVKKNSLLEGKIEKVFDKMIVDPFEISLKTHKVRSKFGVEAFSTSINGDLRIIWDFSQNRINIIDLLDIGGHSGSSKVYQ
jgi:mRNA-degrading endonuclease YafQ of YafQ-DinJ toxin-antitoxin module